MTEYARAQSEAAAGATPLADEILHVLDRRPDRPYRYDAFVVVDLASEVLRDRGIDAAANWRHDEKFDGALKRLGASVVDVRQAAESLVDGGAVMAVAADRLGQLAAAVGREALRISSRRRSTTPLYVRTDRLVIAEREAADRARQRADERLLGQARVIVVARHADEVGAEVAEVAAALRDGGPLVTADERHSVGFDHGDPSCARCANAEATRL